MAKKPSAPAVMLNLTIGHWVARLIYVAAKLKLADLLKDGPRTTAQLATATGVQAPALYRVLRALASVGVFAETKGGRFKLTPLAATLRSDVPGSMRAWAIMANEKYTWDSWDGPAARREDRRDTVRKGPRGSRHSSISKNIPTISRSLANR